MFDLLQLSDHLFVRSALAESLEAVVDTTAEAMLDAPVARLVLLAWSCDDIAP